jgi:Holliday junction resolvase-like predicted endonuclease
MPTPYEIGNAGEGYVVDHLKGRGYTIDKWDTHASGSADIEAHDEKHKIFVQVKSAITDEPSNLSAKEQRNITSRATKIGAIAWEAKVILNTNLDLIGDIRWRQLD